MLPDNSLYGRQQVFAGAHRSRSCKGENWNELPVSGFNLTKHWLLRASEEETSIRQWCVGVVDGYVICDSPLFPYLKTKPTDGSGVGV